MCLWITRLPIFSQLKLHLILPDLGAWAQSRLYEYNISKHTCFLLNSSGIGVRIIRHNPDSIGNSEYWKFKWCKGIGVFFCPNFRLSHVHYTTVLILDETIVQLNTDHRCSIPLGICSYPSDYFLQFRWATRYGEFCSIRTH